LLKYREFLIGHSSPLRGDPVKKPLLFLTLMVFLITACSGAQSEVKKSWRNTENTLRITDLTSNDYNLSEASGRLYELLEEKIDGTGFIPSGKDSRYELKYKVLEFNEGSRFGRIATFGGSQSARARLKVKVALVKEGNLVGGWVVDSWVKGGIIGGSPSNLFQKAAEKIADNLKGDF
jgi:hypothetical protein